MLQRNVIQLPEIIFLPVDHLIVQVLPLFQAKIKKIHKLGNTKDEFISYLLSLA